jgi:type IV secretory pathway TrbD component
MKGALDVFGGGMRAWFILGVAFFAMAVVLALWQSRDDEEMFIHLGNRDLRSLPV